MSFFTCSSEKDTIFGAAINFFWPSYFVTALVVDFLRGSGGFISKIALVESEESKWKSCCITQIGITLGIGVLQ